MTQRFVAAIKRFPARSPARVSAWMSPLKPTRVAHDRPRSPQPGPMTASPPLRYIVATADRRMVGPSPMPTENELVDAEMPREDASDEAGESSDLVRRARRGDRSAIDALFVRLFPWLRRRARGRLPSWARGVLDTSDIVQDVLLHTIRRLSGFESSSSIAFRAYLLRAVDHRIRDEMRRVGRRDTRGGLEEEAMPASQAPSPLQQLIDDEARKRYLRALKRLNPREQRLIVGRGELRYTFKQLALIDDRASPDASRKALRRALVRLSVEMDA